MNSTTKQASDIRSDFLPYALPSIGEEEIAEVVEALRSGWVTTGPRVARFEADFRQYIGCENALAVNSCTAGLHIALTALGVGPGDEVIVPTMTFCSTANVVVHLGAKPVLVDVGLDGNATAAALEQAITPRTKALVPVHYGGQACDLAAIYALAAERRLPVVEDAAHAVGSSYRDFKIGSDDLSRFAPDVRRITVFSFYATKNMTTGEGGMIVTPDSELADRMRMLSLHGMNRDAWKRYTNAGSWYYEVLCPGYKDNMTDLQAAMGIHQLRKLDSFIGVRQAYAETYTQAFSALPSLQPPPLHADRDHVYHLYPIRLVPDRLSIDRAGFIEALTKRNIGTSVHFIPVHRHPFYRDTFGYCSDQFPTAEAIFDSCISLPIYPLMTEEDVAYVIESVAELVSASTKGKGA